VCHLQLGSRFVRFSWSSLSAKQKRVVLSVQRNMIPNRTIRLDAQRAGRRADGLLPRSCPLAPVLSLGLRSGNCRIAPRSNRWGRPMKRVTRVSRHPALTQGF
jgi:hypothetical protein